MASHSIVNTRAVDDLVIDEDDQFLPKTKTSRSSTPSSSNTPSTSVSASDTDEEPAGLVKDTIIKGMCMCLFSGTADLRKLNFKKIEIDFTTFFFWFTLFCINKMSWSEHLYCEPSKCQSKTKSKSSAGPGNFCNPFFACFV